MIVLFLMTDELDTQFELIVQELIKQGEDKEEMEYWVDIYPDLPSGHQKEMLELFKKELEELRTEEQERES